MLVAALALSVLPAVPALAQTRIATVNLQKVFDKYWKTEQASAALKDRAAEFEKTHKEMLDDYRKDKDEYKKLVEQANDQAVSSEERAKRKQAAEDKLAELKKSEDDITQFERQASATISEQKARMRKNILDEIKGAVQSKAKTGGYSLVIDSGTQTYVADPSGPYYSPTILYSSDDSDLTETVLAQLNAGAPLATPKTNDTRPGNK
jgi:outer membrane protein